MIKAWHGLGFTRGVKWDEGITDSLQRMHWHKVRRAYKLRGSATQLHSRPEEDWSIQSNVGKISFFAIKLSTREQSASFHEVTFCLECLDFMISGGQLSWDNN